MLINQYIVKAFSMQSLASGHLACRIRSQVHTKAPEVGAGAFFALLRFRAREREDKKRARKREEKRARKKAKAPSAKEQKREIALFPPPTVKIRFQSPKPLGRGKAMVSKTIQ
jgi:hypothetical protein